MFYLIAILVVVWLVLILLLAAWTMWFQSFIYSEPVGEIFWRAPAAGTAVALFLVVWVAIDYRSGEGRYRPLHDFSPTETKHYDKLWIVNRDGREEEYQRKTNAAGVGTFQRQLSDGSVRRLPERPNKIIVSEANGDKHTFEPDRDAKGNFKPENGTLHYRDDRKLVMDETYPGDLAIFHFGWLVVNLILNFGLLVAWFLSLWLLLRFQWSHALGLAVVVWAISLFLLPMLLTYAENVAKQRAAPAAQRYVAPPAMMRCSSPRYQAG